MIAVGVDTHKERHYAVALDHLGQMLAELSFPASAAGYAELQLWAERLVDGEGLVFGLEGTGSWGAGLCQHLQHAGYSVFEVERPRRKPASWKVRPDRCAHRRQERPQRRERLDPPRGRGILTAIRALLIARRSAVTERTRVLNQLQALNATAPIALRERIGEGTGKQLERRILSMRARSTATLEERIGFSVMRDLAAHSRTLAADANRYEQQLAHLIRKLDDTLLDEPGIGPISAAKLLAFDPTRFTSEGAFARCNGTAPIPASSGKTIRYRLNRGGDRQANNAIHTIAIIRAKHQPETRAYLDRPIRRDSLRGPRAP